MTKPSPNEDARGVSQTVKDQGTNHSPMKHGGSQTNDLTPKNVAGTSSSATKSNSGESTKRLQLRGTNDSGSFCFNPK